MKKQKKKIVLSTLLIFLLLFVEILYAPYSFAFRKIKGGYEIILKEGVTNKNARVVDIKMLGAHDAFSHQIGLASKADPAERGILTSGIVSTIFKGGIVRVTRAQNSDAQTLLKAGVRYFDVRISNVEGVWYTKHGLLSAPLETYLADIYTFLNEYPSEFIIFDVQHIYVGNASLSTFFDYLLETKIGEHRFRDFLHFTANATSLGELTYHDVITNTRGGIIFLINEDEEVKLTKGAYYYNRGDGEDGALSIRSHWHNVNTFTKIYPLVSKEQALIANNNAYLDMFRINQAQLTPDYMKYPLHTISNWSLLDLAATSNKQYLKQENFVSVMEMLPIFMVDYANTKRGNFNQNINELIISLNQKL